MKANENLKPRDTLNTILSIGFALLALFLLWLTSHVGILYSIIISVVFSYLLLINFFLFHEGSHNNQHSNPTTNYLLANLSCWLFPISFTFYQKVHLYHHQKNRSEHENFEYYYADDPLWMTIFRHLQWYSIMLGTYWVLLPLMSSICALFPQVLRSYFFRQFSTSSTLFDSIDAVAVSKIRLETLAGTLFWLGVWLMLDLQIASVAICYAFFAFNWSTRQYAHHAFAPVNRKHGAHNLKHYPFVELLYLHSTLHLTHHQHPDIPWHLLPQYANGEPTIDYGTQYRRLWNAPQLRPSANVKEAETS